MATTRPPAGPLTVHMIGNAHLDPVWLWHWQRGSDEAIATCRAACDLLDDYPDAVFSRGEAWVYEQVRTLDPALFRRIRGHIAARRWDVTGGWWVQADTNLPTAEATRKSIELGLAWFRRHLGIRRIPVAYLVDSFGHGSFLPRILREAGQRYFVMMRPDAGEKALPSSLFRWRSPDGHEVLTFRIPGGYTTVGPDLTDKVRSVIAAAPKGIGHVMCFYGVGDHGGGPTRAAVEWIRAHRKFAPNVRLVFSSPARFFAAVESARRRCPVVEGQLEPHAIGCYSVCGALKRDLRAAELEILDAEPLVARRARSRAAACRPVFEDAWRTICFNQFHDILPGSAVREAVAVARDQVGGVRDRVARVVHEVLRRDSGLARASRVTGHRVHAVNRLDVPWSGLAEEEVWTDWQPWEHHLVDESGRPVPCQTVPPSFLEVEERSTLSLPRLLFPLELPARGHRVLQIRKGAGAAVPAEGAPVFNGRELTNGRITATFGRWGLEQVEDTARGRGWALLSAPLSFSALADSGDTWGHSLLSLNGPVMSTAEFDPPVVVFSGPLRTLVRMTGRVGTSPLRLFAWLDRGDRIVHLRLDASYREPMTTLKASFAPHFGVHRRQDRVGGGWVARPGDGKEYPLHHAVVTDSQTVGPMGLLLPDTFALDGTSSAVRPTLIRNNMNAFNQWAPRDVREHPRIVERFGSDEGPNSLRLSLVVGDRANPKAMEGLLARQQRMPWIWDDFRSPANRLSRFATS